MRAFPAVAVRTKAFRMMGFRVAAARKVTVPLASLRAASHCTVYLRTVNARMELLQRVVLMAGCPATSLEAWRDIPS